MTLFGMFFIWVAWLLVAYTIGQYYSDKIKMEVEAEKMRIAAEKEAKRKEKQSMYFWGYW